MSKYVNRAVIELTDGRTIDITEEMESAFREVEGHWADLRQRIEQCGGNYNQGFDLWESKYDRAMGEETLANTVIAWADLAGIKSPDYEDYPENAS